jgi:hypothetical protein
MSGPAEPQGAEYRLPPFALLLMEDPNKMTHDFTPLFTSILSLDRLARLMHATSQASPTA